MTKGRLGGAETKSEPEEVEALHLGITFARVVGWAS